MLHSTSICLLKKILHNKLLGYVFFTKLTSSNVTLMAVEGVCIGNTISYLYKIESLFHQLNHVYFIVCSRY